MMALPLFSLAQKEDTYEKNGKEVKVTRYYEDGNIRETGTFVNDVPDGKWVEFDQNGQVKKEAFYKDGKKEGKWYVWTDDDQFLYEVIYADNKMVESHKWKIEERGLLAGK